MMRPDLTHGSYSAQRADTDAVDVARSMLRLMLDGRTDKIGVELADGSMLYAPDGATRAVVVAKDLGALRSLILGADSTAAARRIVEGDLDVRGDVEHAIAQFERLSDGMRARDAAKIAAMALRLPRSHGEHAEQRARHAYHAHGRKHSIDRDKAAIAYHYDVSNEFYELWLDRELVYSCAYFKDGVQSLDDAQLAKLDHICRKLRLQAGESLIDVGCGWGSLVRFAAREYGAKAVGITLSRRQAEYARRRIEAEGLADRCAVELLDYRELGKLGPFDKAASVGMVEHVGVGMLPVYFSAVHDALAPGGLFLNHGITSQRTRPSGLAALIERFAPKRSTFIERYVFPDGDLPRIDQITIAAEGAGFEVRDVENLREHYATTLRHWVRRLEANEARARAAVGDETYNVWRFYISGSAHGFSVGRMGLGQTLLAKRLPDGTVRMPPTRDDLYRRES
ncbi:MAG TPA: cyclopropane-fatty-acyl-phospholipid synthase family protein [Candidatus Eremiobacteraceae bacterium]|nr:cyclopropane-fatty-acyl-phospholipid synthase family protein [Candidatus Eremiobacteraceae bacterium]